MNSADRSGARRISRAGYGSSPAVAAAAAVAWWCVTFLSAADPPRRLEGRGFDSGGTGIQVRPEPKKITLIQVTPVRTWKHSDGRSIEAVLVGTRAPDQNSGPVQLILQRKEKSWVQLLKGGKVYEFPLDQLSQPDQDYVRKLVEAQEPGSDREPEPKDEESAPERPAP